jgi:hypothetical protein
VSERSSISGIALGTIISICFIGWLGYQHYENTKDDRLPLKLKQDMVNIQKKLPIKLSQDITLENYQLQQNSINLVFRTTNVSKIKISQQDLVSRINFLACNWRNNFFNKDPLTLYVELLDLGDNKLVSVKNTPQTCATIPRTLPQKIKA